MPRRQQQQQQRQQQRLLCQKNNGDVVASSSSSPSTALQPLDPMVLPSSTGSNAILHSTPPPPPPPRQQQPKPSSSASTTSHSRLFPMLQPDAAPAGTPSHHGDQLPSASEVLASRAAATAATAGSQTSSSPTVWSVPDGGGGRSRSSGNGEPPAHHTSTSSFGTASSHNSPSFRKGEEEEDDVDDEVLQLQKKSEELPVKRSSIEDDDEEEEEAEEEDPLSRSRRKKSESGSQGAKIKSRLHLGGSGGGGSAWSNLVGQLKQGATSAVEHLHHHHHHHGDGEDREKGEGAEGEGHDDDEDEEDDEECDGFISQIGEDGNIEQVPVKYNEDGEQVIVLSKKASLDKGDEEQAVEKTTPAATTVSGAVVGADAIAAVAAAAKAASAREDDDDEGEDEEKTNVFEFMSADILAKPFNFVSGSTSRNRFNPFRKKKSGLLNVLAKQATRSRLVGKNGMVNTTAATDGKTHHYFKDFFITLLDLSWRWVFCLFAAGFLSSWFLFACVWYLTMLQHGDFDEANRAPNSSHVPCVQTINDFTSCFLFSIETQHTIGYGTRATTEQCPFAVLVMCLQSIVGVIIQACMAGIIFAKFTVPRARGETIIFSKNAVVTMRNGELFLLCRISDLRRYSLLEAHVRMIVVRKERTEEGESIPHQQTDLECGSEVDGTNDRVLILWPTTISHKIDEDSPFYEMTPRDMLSQQFEILVVLEGITEETGNTVQARTSYLPNEILWGHHFENESVVFDKKAGIYSVQHSCINKTVVDLTPRCSAKQLAHRREKRTSSAMTTSSSEEISPRTTFRIEQKP